MIKNCIKSKNQIYICTFVIAYIVFYMYEETVSYITCFPINGNYPDIVHFSDKKRNPNKGASIFENICLYSIEHLPQTALRLRMNLHSLKMEE